MATVELPLPDPTAPDAFVQRYRLDGGTFFFGYRWNDRDGYWYMSVADSDRLTLVANIRMVLGEDRLHPYKYLPVPQGSFDVFRGGEDSRRRAANSCRESIGSFKASSKSLSAIAVILKS